MCQLSEHDNRREWTWARVARHVLSELDPHHPLKKILSISAVLHGIINVLFDRSTEHESVLFANKVNHCRIMVMGTISMGSFQI